MDLDPQVWGSVELLVPGGLCKVFDLRTNGLAQRIHLVVQIHLVDLRLLHPLIHVVEPEFKSSELLAEYGDVVLLLLLVVVCVGVHCDAMDMILARELVGEIWDCRKGVEWQALLQFWILRGT